jgi:hypothetical protein
MAITKPPAAPPTTTPIPIEVLLVEMESIILTGLIDVATATQ